MEPLYAANIKLPFDLDLRSAAIFSCPPNKLGHVVKDVSTIDHRLVKFLSDHQIKIGHAEAFYTPPRCPLPIHIDSDKISDLAKMNFVYGAKGSTMSWWALKNPGAPLPVKLTSIGTKYVLISPEDATLMHTVEIGRPTIVNVGRPHSINNSTPYMRWCLSLVMWGLDVNRNLTIDECVERLKAHL